MPKKKTPPKNTEEKLDVIIDLLQKNDRREKRRSIGALIHGLFSLIPAFILLLSVWYIYSNGERLLDAISRKAAEQAAAITQGQAAGILDQFDGFLR